MAKQSKRPQFNIDKCSPSYWRIIIDNPPFNLFGPDTIPQFDAVVTALESDSQVKVAVFESAVPGFFLTHYDFIPPLEATTKLPPGPTGLPPLPDMLVRIGRAPVVSIAKIRGRATGVGSELALASDMRFASNEGALLSHWEIGAALVPGGGPMTRLSRLIGRGRALEMLMSGNEVAGELAERYGYVNRSFPDVELDEFVDTLATRIASFDKETLAAIKLHVNKETLPPESSVAPEWDAFIASVGRPAAQEKIAQLMALGLQHDQDVESRLSYYAGTLWR
ncbi:enoyl-CoA hydratase/isomerase family protein [Caballeronia novacaledonica]|uniref:Enoyl-CoA hydratase/isomerase family protein n=1 Tax=Caballeronia novacaledonica TaxID=1544861 RepID=A0AA37MS02_9BURK|nr:enoyl-CoA hydratase/isomerase family protein [Caballeronia novacaledonica]GJH13247.1 enoyl-CoA hydratase/isomerase family protein [Caballeronia novacaledonica]GJH28996.1 enoyl-CoA hydratase/isomerase family protein [Caballeronia novacaledonica]